MCLTFCHKRNILYDSDTNEVCDVCPDNWGQYKSCQTCNHRRDKQCGLTSAPIPEDRWCCHYNVIQVDGTVLVEMEQLKGQSVRSLGLRHAFQIWDTEYSDEGDGQYQVILSSLAVPLVFGMPMTHWANALLENSKVVWDRDDISLPESDFVLLL